MELGLQHRVAFIAGSSDGIGRAIAATLAAEGCRIMLAARRGDVLALLKEQLHTAHGVDIAYVTGDLDSADDIARMQAATLSRFERVDILVTNNGGPRTGSFDLLSEDDWSHAWNKTLMSAVRLIRGFLPGMTANGWGRVVNITSIAVKQPVQRLMLSNAYRAAVTGMARTLSDEVASRGITVNCIAPGYIGTDRLRHLFADRAVQSGSTPDAEHQATIARIPAGRLGEPGEIAALAAFLASDKAAYITGTTIQVDGGVYRGLL
jgi:3-oxoacyl-[acyl-carrier protein] reductase